MRTVVLDPLPPEIEQLIERRKLLGQDLYDEVWEGTYHMAPTARGRHGIVQSALLLVLAPHAEAAGLVATGPFNLGTAKDDFRVPDLGCHRGHIDPDLVYYATAAVVVEILSPHDETWEKLPFYASRGVDEVMVVDPEMRQVRIFVLGAGGYGEAGTSAMFGVEASEVEGAIRWP